MFSDGVFAKKGCRTRESIPPPCCPTSLALLDCFYRSHTQQTSLLHTDLLYLLHTCNRVLTDLWIICCIMKYVTHMYDTCYKLYKDNSFADMNVHVRCM